MVDLQSALRRSRLPWKLLAGILIALALWAVVAFFTLLRVVDAAGAARESLEDTRAELSIDSLVDGTARDNMRALRSDLRSIDRNVSSPILAPLRIVPGLGRQIRSADALGSAGVEGTGIGLEILDELTGSLEGPLPSGPERLALLDRIITLISEGRATLGELSLGPDGPLFPELATARQKATEGLRDLDEFLVSAEALTTSLRTLLAEGNHLLLVSNNAEMRSGSGMFLQMGTLDAADGAFSPSELVSAEDIVLPPPGVPAESPTYSDLWGFLEPTREWRNLAASPRFEVTAELATRMWEALGNPRPSGAIVVDPFALRALLRATGPVNVNGVEIGGENVVPFILNDQYSLFGDPATDDAAEAARQDQLALLVDATFAALESAPVDPVRLLEGLRDAVRGRHILAWSADPALQAGWAAADMSGELAADSLMVSVLNRGANKLDPFVDVAVDLDFAKKDLETLAGTMEITVSNRVPDGEVRYVAGPGEGVPTVQEYGDYAGILSVSLPGVARNARIEGVPSLEVANPDGPILAVASKFVLPQGATHTFVVSFEVPRTLASVRLEPDARPEPVSWRVGERTWSDGEHHRIDVSA